MRTTVHGSATVPATVCRYSSQPNRGGFQVLGAVSGQQACRWEGQLTDQKEPIEV